MPKIYETNGIHFKHPGNWRVTSDSQGDGVRFLFLETPWQATVAIQGYLATEAQQIEAFAREFPSIVKKEMPQYVTVRKLDIRRTIRFYKQSNSTTTSLM
jgi:hypothetical protein